MFFFLRPAGHIATARDLVLVIRHKQIELCEHRAQPPLLLAEKLPRGQNGINERSSFRYRDLLHDCYNGKV